MILEILVHTLQGSARRGMAGIQAQSLFQVPPCAGQVARVREQLAAHKELSQKLVELEARVSGHDESIGNLFEAIRQLVEPAVPENRREIGFMREDAAPYRIRKNYRN